MGEDEEGEIIVEEAVEEGKRGIFSIWGDCLVAAVLVVTEIAVVNMYVREREKEKGQRKLKEVSREKRKRKEWKGRRRRRKRRKRKKEKRKEGGK